MGAILAEQDPTGWVNDIAVQSPWKRAGDLRVVPSDRQVSNREKSSEDHAELRLLQALQGVAAEVVIIDAPNRQGGPLIQNALAQLIGSSMPASWMRMDSTVSKGRARR